MGLWRPSLLNVSELLARCVQLDGSDLHLKTDTGKVYVRVHGDLVELEDVEPFDEKSFMLAMKGLLREQQLKRFEDSFELDFALEVPGVSRFRGNMFRQRGTPQAIFRVIPFEIQSMDDLALPDLCYDLIERPRGLVLVTGPAGSGKSTTLASMIDSINRSQEVHIVTVEDPVEFVHDDHTALINQRELDIDTLSFANALKYVLRQDPDVILVGEMRDLETIHLAITAAETGHLVFGTLHTVDALQTVDRIVDVFPQHQQQQIRMQLSVNLLGVISQTLVPRKDKRGRTAAFEVLNCTPAIRNLIRENKTYQISSIIQTGAKQKMQTLDQGLARLVERGLIDIEVARSKAKDAAEFMRIVSLGIGKAAPAVPSAADRPHVNYHESEVIHALHPEDSEVEQSSPDSASAAPYESSTTGQNERHPLDAELESIPVPQPPGQTSSTSGPTGTAGHRSVAPAQTARPVPNPAPASAPSPAARGDVPADPFNSRPAGKLIDPVTKAPEKSKKKGLFSALFGGRD